MKPEGRRQGNLGGFGGSGGWATGQATDVATDYALINGKSRCDESAFTYNQIAELVTPKNGEGWFPAPLGVLFGGPHRATVRTPAANAAHRYRNLQETGLD